MVWYIADDGFAATVDSFNAVPVENMLQLTVLLMWTCLKLTYKGKNPIFEMVFPNTSILAGVISACGLVYAPGLFAVVQGTVTPTMAFFKSLPSDFHKKWAVYLLVLEKPLCIPLIYVGSGTSALSGVSSRMGNYDNLTILPRYVRKALDEGYVITHKGLLAWIRLPQAKDVPLFRAFFLLLEATLAFVFWAVRTKSSGTFSIFGLRPLCPYDVDNLWYAGLCSHNPLIEGISGNFELSADELEDLDNQRKEWRKQQISVYHVGWYEIMKNKDPEGRRAQNRATHAVRYAKDAPKTLAKNKRARDRAQENARFRCDPCDYNASHQKNLDNHLLSIRHFETTGTEPSKWYICGPCGFRAPNLMNHNQHCRGKRHLAKVSAGSSGSS